MDFWTSSVSKLRNSKFWFTSVAVLPTTRDECTFYDEKEKRDNGDEEKCDRKKCVKECDESGIFTRDEMSVELKKMRNLSAPSLMMSPLLGFGWAVESQMKKVGSNFMPLVYSLNLYISGSQHLEGKIKFCGPHRTINHLGDPKLSSAAHLLRNNALCNDHP